MSCSPNLSVWVTKNGNDSSICGPFLTIAAARTYLKNNFTLSSAQHGLLKIGPGVWDESISITATDEDRYIDYEGSGIDVTSIKRSVSSILFVSCDTAENRFSKMTIEYTGATAGEYPVDIDCCANLVISDCMIKSTKRCVHRLYDNAMIRDSWIVSSATNAETVMYMISGILSNCDIRAPQLAAPGYVIDSISQKSRTYNCIVSSISTLGTPPDARCVNDIRGVVKDCRFEAQGYSVNIIQLGAVVENSVFSSEGSGGAKVVDTLAQSLVNGCVFHQKGSNLNVISFVRTGVPKAFNTAFIAPNSNVDVIDSIEIDGTEWYDCSFNNNGTGGWAMDASAAGRTIKVGNITSNRPLDPDFNITTNISDYGAFNVTSVKTSAYTARINDLVCCNPTGGAFTVTLPVISATNKGMTLVVKNQSASTNAITIARAGANTIDGATSITINTARGSRRLVSDGNSDWMVL